LPQAAVQSRCEEVWERVVVVAVVVVVRTMTSFV
jgi:hypothetical protein